MDCFSQEVLKTHSEGKKKKQISTCSPTPKLKIFSMPLIRTQDSGKKTSDTYLVSTGKKAKMQCGPVPYYSIQLVNAYTGKSVYQPFVHEVKFPMEPCKLEPENILTDEVLIEYAVNTIKDWVNFFVNMVK